MVANRNFQESSISSATEPGDTETGGSSVAVLDTKCYQDALDKLPFGVSLFDGELQLRFANQQYFELFEYPDNLSVPGTALVEILRYSAERGDYGSGDVEASISSILSRTKKPESHRFELTLHDKVLLEAVCTPISSGGIIITYTDITESRRIQSDLADDAETYHRIFETESDAIVVADDQSWQIVEVNEAACELYGYPSDLMLKMKLHALSGEFGKKYAQLQSAREKEDFFRASGIHRKCDNSLFNVELTISRCQLANRSVLVAVMRDMTEQVHIKEKLRLHRDALQQLVDIRTRDLIAAKNDAEAANSAKSDFLASMSHEFRTPMHAILSFSELGSRYMAKSNYEKAVNCFERINQSGKYLLQHINDLLDLSKLEAGKMTYHMEPNDLVNTVEYVINELSSLASTKGVLLSLLPASNSTTVRCDSGRVAQIIRNLISNAIKFTPAGKCITVAFDQKTILRGRRKNDTATIDAIEIRVVDQGEGIAEDELESIFDVFVQARKKKTGKEGTGLGLSICKTIVSAHGGKIHAQSNRNGGVTFVVLLPVDGPLAGDK